QPLAQLVYRKTHGNPFFTAQFLQGLHAEQHITFNAEVGQWQCDLAQIRKASLTDNVVEFMVQRLQTLPLPTQEVLKFAACIGNRFDLASLLAVYAASSGLQASQEQVTADLWQALQVGLIIPERETYKFFSDVESGEAQHPIVPQDAVSSRPNTATSYRFLHDRVQQAAYALIPETQKASIHCTIGRGLLAQLSPSQQDEMLFTIVAQLNLGREVFSSATERAQLAELNLQAGRKARLATAYGAAIDYLVVARQSLAPDCWQANYATTLNIFIETLETHYLNTHFDRVKGLAEEILAHTQTLLDAIKVYEVLIRTSVAQSDQHQALETGLQVLQMLDIKLLDDKPAAVANVAALMDAPAMTDPHKLAAMGIMAYIVTPAWSVNPVYFRTLTFTMVDLSLRYGNCGASAFGYAWYGTLLCEALGNIDEGYGFGRLSIVLLDRFEAQEFRSKVLNLYASCTRFWKEHLKESLPVHLEGTKWGLETGDLEFASYCAVEHCHYLLLAGMSLHQVRDTAQQKLSFVHHLKQGFHIDYLAPLLQASLNLMGESDTITHLAGVAYQETERLPDLIEQKQLTTVFVAYFLKSLLSYLFEDIDQALEYGQKAREYSGGVTGTFFISAELFYSSLARIAALEGMEPVQQQAARQDINECLAKLQHWAAYAPMNYQHKCELLLAELARHDGQFIAAMDAYDRAIAGAKFHDFIHEEALANELAAKFYLHWGKEKFAACYMQEAYYGYARWGSEAKLNDLTKRYHHLLQPILQQAVPSTTLLDTLATVSPPNLTVYSTGGVSSSSSTSMNSALDFTSVLRAFQAISDTIQLDDLLQQLTRIMLQTSGGDRCILALPGSKNRWYIRADASADDCTLEVIPFADNPPAPVQLMRYVRNTQEILMVDSLGTDIPVVDSYLTHNRPQSLVCLPMMYHDNLVGVLYLQNQLTRRAFSQERILVLNFLCTQAAISIENARLYRQEQKRSRKLAQKEAEYRSIFEGVNDGLCIINLETGQMVAANPTMCRMYGYAQ
ncbi:MAG: GAF domain-containing protein, partial [Cyanobacteria bacterium P01_D01_bin.56]